jgi:hypothetical protein
VDARLGRAEGALAAIDAEIKDQLQPPIDIPPCGVTVVVTVEDQFN